MAKLTPNQSLPISEHQLDCAYKWLCRQRLHFPANADIWSFRFNWHSIKYKLLQQVCSGEYRLSPLSRIVKSNGRIIHCWCSSDALILKLLATLLQAELDLSPNCSHIKGHGGLKHCVVDVQQQINDYQFVCKTDVKQFYQSIDHTILLKQCDLQIVNKYLRRYLYHIIRRTIEYGGLIVTSNKALPEDAPLVRY